MTIDLTGIDNQNEFYTHHYLRAILEEDLKDVFRKWTERDEQEKVRPPYAQLRGLYKEYFTTRSLFERQKTDAARLELQRELERQLLEVLGYPFAPGLRELDEAASLPVLGEVKKPNGAPELWVIEAVDDTGEQQDPLTLKLRACQYPEGQSVPAGLAEATFDEIVTRYVFGRSEPPRWVLLVGASQVVLIDRGKWNEKRLLRFDLNEILGRRESSTLQATAALLHRDSVCPAEGMSLLDNLDENSHKHAHAVSEDLKYALREAIELLGNEVVYYRRRSHQALYEGSKDELDARQLTLECLRYMYRLLFLFYIEARPELGYAPVKAEAYRKGYSLECLRDIELVKLTTEESKNGTYLSDSLHQLFRLIYDGFQPREKGMRQLALADEGKPLHNTFQLTPLRSHLFDPKRTPTLNKVKVRNWVMQRIVELMSLSRAKGRRERRGRVSYAQLGINQLGAVYEALLSFSGFFAQTDLYEVKKADEKADELATAYFVPEDDVKDYTEQERVFNDDGTLKKYEKGTFIYRLAGRFRETSASYYTPEVLTQCLVKYALKELLPGKTADEILHLTVCEPAMGSAAFLNEAINQLADAYLDLKQKELGRKLLVTAPKPDDQDPNDPYCQTEDYATIKQRVKTYIADNNVFGVDLNPVAVELAEVSLWLNTMAPGGFIPWFGNQLACGNSLVGARRQVFKAELLAGKTAGWLDQVPERVQVGKARPEGSVYHFLMGEKGMSSYGEGTEDNPIGELAAKELQTIKDWRQEFCQPLSKDEVEGLQELSDAIDKLWDAQVEMQARIRQRTTDPMHVWGQVKRENVRPPTTTEWKDRVLFQEMFSKDVRASSPYRRLKLAMDYWCALWFWPIEKAESLPSRGEFLLELSLILRGDVLEVSRQDQEQLPLFSETQPKEEARHLIDEFGYVNVDRLCDSYPRLTLVRDIAEGRHRFFHWELEYADQYARRGGFNLILGNPPWKGVRFEEVASLSSWDPLIAIRNLHRDHYDTYASRRSRLLRAASTRRAWYDLHEECSGLAEHLSSDQYPDLAGTQPSLSKAFLCRASLLGAPDGVAAYVHDKGPYDDARGGRLRSFLYRRLAYSFRFYNQQNHFPEDVLGHAGEFYLSVYRSAPKSEVGFDAIAGLIIPKSIDESFANGSPDRLLSLRNDEGEWESRGNLDRVIHVDEAYLKTSAELLEGHAEDWASAKIAMLQSASMLSAVQKMASSRDRLSAVKSEFLPGAALHEKGALEKGHILKAAAFPKSLFDTILSGPHYYVLNPCAKTPNDECGSKGDYTVLDVQSLPFCYLPRTIFQLSESGRKWLASAKAGATVREARFACRGMGQRSNERTLIPTLLPPGILHTHGTYALAHSDPRKVAELVAVAGSLLGDFLVRLSGRTNIVYDSLKGLPLLGDRAIPGIVRVLRLTCLTSYYEEVWNRSWTEAFCEDDWHTARESRLALGCRTYALLSPVLTSDVAFRSAYQRRFAQVELDVVVAQAVKLTLKELRAVYCLEFEKLHEYEQNTWFDSRGRIVYTCNRNLPGVGLPRTSREGPCWEDVKSMQSGAIEQTVMDDTLPGGPRKKTIVYHAPFDRCDRERDYEVVWAEFEKRYGKVRTKK